jgi:antirestriction protein
MTAQVYVGTYAKYNAGSIAGAWLNLEDYQDKDAFYTACAELHKDEEDPEFMLQDFEGFPEKFYSESGLPEELFDWLALDDNEKEILEAYIEATGDASATLDDANDAYYGQFDSDVDFTQQLLEDCGEIPKDLPNYIVIDWEATARQIMWDFMEYQGFYFRNA